MAIFFKIVTAVISLPFLLIGIVLGFFVGSFVEGFEMGNFFARYHDENWQ